ncbi:hypothetical protein [Acetobacter sicerae]|uniref:hypothetical protein n=1 Tax=Acetobacter sicerae TaxID=85325 RepID=UPI00156AD9B8|nr:hypothetical protein [Acetobacter sicerae]NHN93852.1 hypothetical protein [Acetobacter sicerae]
MTRKLGKLAARHDPRAPKMARLSLMQRTAPARLLRDHIDPAPLMLGNDQTGDCTSVGLANAFRAQAALGGFQVSVTTEDAVRFYSKSTGYVPGNEATDRGGYELDVLTMAGRDGYALETQTIFPIWGNIDKNDLNGIRLCMAAFGGVYNGLALAEADMWQDEQGNLAPVWDTETPTERGDPTPGSAGGHCTVYWSYSGIEDTDLVSILTWGMVQKATWRWVRSRMDEAHALAFPQLKPASGLLSNEDFDRLRSENSDYLTRG